MRLRALSIVNYACIGEPGITVPIDNIVTLIGPNNSGKSSILDAYEAFASTGAALPLSCFRDENPKNTVSISGVFSDITEEDREIIGTKWEHEDKDYGRCVRAKWEWSDPNEKGQKYSWDPVHNKWVPGGMGGWDTLITNRIPAPLRVKPTDDPEKTEAQIVEILTAAAKAALKKDAQRASKVLGELQALADEFAKEAQKELDETCETITKKLTHVFPGHEVRLQHSVGKIDADKIIGNGSHVRIKEPDREAVSLSQQGAGLRRTFLWSALGTLAEIGRFKKGKSTLPPERPRLLLIEEPESFLHPPMIRSAREALYDLAEVEEWQVLTSTHSPIFIDVSKPHTTIIRIEKMSLGSPQLFRSDNAQFTEDERAQLRMIRACHPTVNEFFFADEVFLVEGETEQAVLNHLLSSEIEAQDLSRHVVNCMGKANLPLFARILNQFRTPYTIVHDADAPKVQRVGRWVINSMWTLNKQIADVITERGEAAPPCHLLVHIPNFEGYYFGEHLDRDKPYQALKVLRSEEFLISAKHTDLRSFFSLVAKGQHPGLYKTYKELKAKVQKWHEAVQPRPAEAWLIEDEE
ncbi:MAG: ATP-dependent endonuclease [Candidatus Hodarchaeota archaeon]